MNRWLKGVEQRRAAIEAWADSDLPLADEMRALLDEADNEL